MKETVTTTVKLSDVARHAGVSTSTVSRVLNSHPGISNATRLTVLDTLKMLGYKSEAFTNLSPIRDSRTRIDVIICPLAEQKNPMGMNYYSTPPAAIRAFAGELDAPAKTDAGIAFIDTGGYWEKYFANKKFRDLTGNGVNHPNDFGHRFYAETIADVLLP